MIHRWRAVGPAIGAYRKGNEPDGTYFYFHGILERCQDCSTQRLVFPGSGLQTTEVVGTVETSDAAPLLRVNSPDIGSHSIDSRPPLHDPRLSEADNLGM